MAIGMKFLAITGMICTSVPKYMLHTSVFICCKENEITVKIGYIIIAKINPITSPRNITIRFSKILNPMMVVVFVPIDDNNFISFLNLLALRRNIENEKENVMKILKTGKALFHCIEKSDKLFDI